MASAYISFMPKGQQTAAAMGETTLLLIWGNEQMKKPEISVLPRMGNKAEKSNT